MTFLPISIVELLRKIQKISDWIDDKFFPLPVTPEQRKRTEQENIEYCAQLVSDKIKACKKLSECNDCMDLIIEFKSIWGNGVQVRCWFDSLFLELNQKRHEISQNK